MQNASINNIKHQKDLVSVIIPCFNHAKYLHFAIKSVLKQSYAPIEIIVIDDGSTDDTSKVAVGFDYVTYIYQSNAGLSAARNRGIKESHGGYILFLDADDWLYPDAISTNMKYFKQNQLLAFVSGSYDNADEAGNITNEYKVTVSDNHYCQLLDYNYIGMIASVLFAKWVLCEFEFNDSLRGCEDHDLYLKIVRKYPVIHHQEKIAVYRRHSNNMSSNNGMMIHTAFQILLNQKKQLQSKKEKKAFRISYNALYKQILWLGESVAQKELKIFKKDQKTYYTYKFYTLLKKSIRSFKHG